MDNESSVKLKEIGKRIRAARIEQHMSQDVLAFEADLSLSTMSDIELGKSNLRVVTLIKIIEALKVSADTILRPDVPNVNGIYQSEFSELLSDCSPSVSFLATIAEEESHTRSRSMETSLRMRLDNGIPLTPKLLGYSHDEDGQLVINPAEAPTVKLCFYMYLYGYSTQQIADALIALGRKSYLGNICWTSNSIVQILRNERHCGYVLTRKTYTPDFRDHKSKKNYGKRPQSLYKNHHEAIVSRDDFIAVQHMLRAVVWRVSRSDIRFMGLTSSLDVVSQYNSGYNAGVSDGYSNGYSNGLIDGKNIGYNDGVKSANNYSFLGLLGAVVDAPIQAVSGLLNFDLLGFNMLNFFYALVTCALVIAVIRMIL